jgi:amino acid transporter
VGIVLGAIIGVGIFITPSKVAWIAGSPEQAMLLWGLGGLIAMAGALCMAEIGARFPSSGGEMLALHQTWGPLPAFLFGWSLLTAINTGVLVIISLFAAENFGVAVGANWSTQEVALAASIGILLLSALNLSGVRHAAWMQTTTSAFKLLVLAGLTCLGIAAMLDSGSPPSEILQGGTSLENGGSVGTTPSPSQRANSIPWLAGLAATLFSYGGFHQLTWVGGEIKDPQKTLPKAIVTGVILVIASYLAANWAYFSLLPFDHVATSTSIASDAIGQRLPEVAKVLTASALCISALGIANSQLLTTPRVYFALAQEGLFPKVLGNLTSQNSVPRIAIVLQGALAILLLWIVGGESIDQLVTGVVFVDWVFHILAVAGLFIARKRCAKAPSFSTPLWPLPALVFMVGGTLALGATFWDASVRQASLLGSFWILLGIPVYFAMTRFQRNSH